jgi:hypothetical protein
MPSNGDPGRSNEGGQARGLDAEEAENGDHQYDIQNRGHSVADITD